MKVFNEKRVSSALKPVSSVLFWIPLDRPHLNVRACTHTHTHHRWKWYNWMKIIVMHCQNNRKENIIYPDKNHRILLSAGCFCLVLFLRLSLSLARKFEMMLLNLWFHSSVNYMCSFNFVFFFRFWFSLFDSFCCFQSSCFSSINSFALSLPFALAV